MDYTRIPLYMPCYNGYYRNEHALNFLDYLFEEYHVDGIWHNAVHAVADICYGDRCRKLYYGATGAELRVPGESSEAEIERYYDWKASRASNHMETLRGKIKGYGEDKAYTAEVFSMFDVSRPRHSGIDLYTARDHFDFLVSVNFLYRNEYKNFGYSASIIRFLQALDPEKQAVILWGQNGTRQRYVMEPPVGSRIFLWEVIASGGGIWCDVTSESAKTVCSYIPRIINQSPEMAWLPHASCKQDYGKGKVVYFANQPGRMNHVMGHPDYSDLLHGAVRYLLDGKPMVTTNAPPSVHIWVNESQQEGQMRYVVSLVNVTSGYERPLRSLSPVQDIEVTLRIPGNQNLRSKLLRKESDVNIDQYGNSITIKIDQLKEFVSIALFE